MKKYSAGRKAIKESKLFKSEVRNNIQVNQTVPLKRKSRSSWGYRYITNSPHIHLDDEKFLHGSLIGTKLVTIDEVNNLLEKLEKDGYVLEDEVKFNLGRISYKKKATPEQLEVLQSVDAVDAEKNRIAEEKRQAAAEKTRLAEEKRKAKVAKEKEAEKKRTAKLAEARKKAAAEEKKAAAHRAKMEKIMESSGEVAVALELLKQKGLNVVIVKEK